MEWIQTLCGQRFDLDGSRPQAISPHTLAVVLARMCRFGGHCLKFYSVAQHSVLVCDLVSAPELKLPALLHDAHEAYWGFGDVCRPAKNLTPTLRAELKEHARRIDVAIASRFGFNAALFHHEAIKHADNVALATEARDIMAPPPETWVTLPDPHFERIEPQGIGDACFQFESRLHKLWGE